MKEKFLYLLGAGASAQALPIVKGPADGKIQGLATSFKGMAIKLRNEHPHDNFSNEFVKQMNQNLLWLQQESENHGTVDTYAKYLYIRGEHDKFNTLKITLSAYFALEQLYRNKLDPRYLAWLTRLLDLPIFPENIKILTWNYDFQMQLAASHFREERFHNGSVSVHSPPLIEYYPPVGKFFPHTTKDFSPHRFNMIHLNGIAGFFNRAGDDAFTNVFLNKEEVRETLSNFINKPDDFTHLLSFAWEKQNRISRRIEFAKALVKDVSTLIVIGYSFPFFNREIDKEILDALKETETLKTIYFQDPYLDGSFLYDQFDLDKQIQIKHIRSTDAFHIPFGI